MLRPEASQGSGLVMRDGLAAKAALWASRRRPASGPDQGEPIPVHPAVVQEGLSLGYQVVLVHPYAVLVEDRVLAWAGPLELVAHEGEAHLWWNLASLGTARWDGRRAYDFRLDQEVSGAPLRAALEAAEAAAALASAVSQEEGEPWERVMLRLRGAEAAARDMPQARAALRRAQSPSTTPTATSIEALAIGAEEAAPGPERDFLQAVLVGLEETLAGALSDPWIRAPAAPAPKVEPTPATVTVEEEGPRRRSWCREPGCYLHANHPPPCRIGMETWI